MQILVQSHWPLSLKPLKLKALVTSLLSFPLLRLLRAMNTEGVHALFETCNWCLKAQERMCFFHLVLGHNSERIRLIVESSSVGFFEKHSSSSERTQPLFFSQRSQRAAASFWTLRWRRQHVKHQLLSQCSAADRFPDSAHSDTWRVNCYALYDLSC